ncbi:hypothetical protein AWB78_07811 [Caballeronia calidae]|uniref:DNA helicase DnaB-like N-terminal domain-containing protein n=1 Tax=Caballeronia calidae TaxID=1777139 RepID=A0A158EJA4_9BURK|nr:DnaB-like helicase N-terminal domain-containing protein [Caballeronia calidae]SAL05987.1 hypothetical protein AWB78_07811 [Caballeronia calidae]
MKFEDDIRTRAEQRVLACLLRKNIALCHCSWLMPHYFSHDQHGMIFAAIRSLIAQGRVADMETVFWYLDETYPRFHVSGDYLAFLAEDLDVTVVHCGYYAAKLLVPGERP